MKHFLNFDTMITPFLVKLIFWLGSLFFIVSSITLIMGHSVSHGLQLLILGPIALRIACELVLVFFNMQADIHHIKSKLKKDA